MGIPCASCGAEQPVDTRFCSMCGAPLHRRCPACGSAQLSSALFCSACGIALREDARRGQAQTS
ncbi:MAG: zinc ribbon domain-containing protein [Actinobacteria bacterium]|nr:zinc ribbon domain-containing protein [Actinomycetota bacterium]